MNPRGPRAEAVRALAGPALITGTVLVLLQGYAFGGKIADGDLPTFWLPTLCFLGRSLAAGDIPAWNPFVMSGVPFAADPQSGWMYLPAMLLFSALPCDVAIRWMVVLQPILAGLGVYWFLRSEGTGRPAATVGGLVLALGIAASQLTNSLPLAGALTWSALSLAACSRYFHARTTAARLLWAGLTALAWGQLAASHFSVGMVMGTGLLAAYAIAKLWDQRFVRDAGTRRTALLLAAALPALFIVVNLGYLLPRLAYLSQTSLGLGYGELDRLSTELSGFVVDRPIPASTPEWPLKLASARGAHPGALALGLVFVPLVAKRFRPTAAAFLLYGLLLYVLSLRALAGWIERRGASWRPADAYLHSPEWWGYGLLVVIAVLAGLGLEAWVGAERKRGAVWLIGPAVVIWAVLPPVFGARWFELSFLWVGAAAGVVILAMSQRRPWIALFAPVAVAAEMLASGLIGYRAPPFSPIPRLLVDRADPTIDTTSYVRPGPVARVLQARPGGRYLLQNLGGWERLQADPRSPLFEIEHIQGYNPVQLRRYWMFVRKVSRMPLPYNLSLFHDPPAVALDLMEVKHVVSGVPYRSASSRIIARPGRLAVHELAGAPPRASVLSEWTVVANADEALLAVTDPAFDPAARVVLEASSEPGGHFGTSGGSAPGHEGTADYTPVDADSAMVRVDTAAPGVLLIRTPYDRNWRATIDGRPASVTPADFLVQAVPVPAGSHTVRLAYDDPLIGLGLAGSLIAVTALAGAIAVVSIRERRP